MFNAWGGLGGGVLPEQQVNRKNVTLRNWNKNLEETPNTHTHTRHCWFFTVQTDRGDWVHWSQWVHWSCWGAAEV